MEVEQLKSLWSFIMKVLLSCKCYSFYQLFCSLIPVIVIQTTLRVEAILYSLNLYIYCLKTLQTLGLNSAIGSTLMPVMHGFWFQATLKQPSCWSWSFPVPMCGTWLSLTHHYTSGWGCRVLSANSCCSLLNVSSSGTSSHRAGRKAHIFLYCGQRLQSSKVWVHFCALDFLGRVQV